VIFERLYIYLFKFLMFLYHFISGKKTGKIDDFEEKNDIVLTMSFSFDGTFPGIRDWGFGAHS